MRGHFCVALVGRKKREARTQRGVASRGRTGHGCLLVVVEPHGAPATCGGQHSMESLAEDEHLVASRALSVGQEEIPACRGGGGASGGGGGRGGGGRARRGAATECSAVRMRHGMRRKWLGHGREWNVEARWWWWAHDVASARMRTRLGQGRGEERGAGSDHHSRSLRPEPLLGPPRTAFLGALSLARRAGSCRTAVGRKTL